MTWEEEAAAVIARIDATIPANASLVDRKWALLEGKPMKFACTSWGAKTWGRARRKYLYKFGPKSDVSFSTPSPKPEDQ